MAADSKGWYQPWSHEEFMADRRVRRMSPLALKTYMMLLHEAYVCSARPNLPDDDQELELMAYCTDHQEWLSIKDEVLGMFERETVDGVPVLVKSRLVKDWGKLQEIREKRSEAGKLGANARWNGKNGTPMATDSNKGKLSKEKVREDNLSEEETDMRAEKQILIACHTLFGVTPRLYDSHKSELKRLESIHKGSAVARAFEEWAQDLDETPSNPVAAFLSVADDRLASGGQAQKASKAPEVVSLVRELTYVSDGRVKFADRQKPLLAELAAEYSQSEILGVFKTWLADQDLTDARKLDFAAKNFVECADALCYSTRRKKQERSQEESLRDAAKLRLQEEAEIERMRAETEKITESELYDPLSVV